jgi:uncharacterized damage-inducible protein DinB
MAARLRVSDPSFYATQLEQTQSGNPWYGPPIAQVVQGLTVEQAAAHPVPGAHSVWEIVLHMTSWVNEVRRRIAEGNPRTPDDGDWPEPPDPTEGNWWQSLDQLEAAHAELREALLKFPESRMAEMVGPTRDAPLGTGVSYAAMIQGLLQHDAYHLGQIALLKRALEKGGGRT